MFFSGRAIKSSTLQIILNSNSQMIQTSLYVLLLYTTDKNAPHPSLNESPPEWHDQARNSHTALPDACWKNKFYDWDGYNHLFSHVFLHSSWQIDMIIGYFSKEPSEAYRYHINKNNNLLDISDLFRFPKHPFFLFRAANFLLYIILKNAKHLREEVLNYSPSYKNMFMSLTVSIKKFHINMFTNGFQLTFFNLSIYFISSTKYCWTTKLVKDKK